ncbi:hypothetical protein HYZ78_01145 [Candidatus Microgenomates bacterium]|nr:hypothetical protein [Candidatus Microgenomates bacterium]
MPQLLHIPKTLADVKYMEIKSNTIDIKTIWVLYSSKNKTQPVPKNPKIEKTQAAQVAVPKTDATAPENNPPPPWPTIDIPILADLFNLKAYTFITKDNETRADKTASSILSQILMIES